MASVADESTPLILPVVETRPARDRYPHHKLRYVCTSILSAVLILGAATVIAVLTFFTPPETEEGKSASISALLPWSKTELPSSWPKSYGIDFSELQEILLTAPDAEKAREWSSYYTSGPHLAGKNLSQAIWTKEKWQEFGIKNSLIVDYDIYVNFPQGHRLALLEKESDKNAGSADLGADDETWKVRFEARLEEEILADDRTSGLPDRIPTFHGYSASGNVTAQYVYVNYGTYEDFEELRSRNISLEGKVALIRYGNVFRGLKVKRAQEMGMVGAVIYTDPGDDGEITEANGYKMYPDGPARHPSSVQRGSCQFLSFAPGDPTTPGYPSKPGVPRQPVDHAIPSIPSIPISYEDALPLLKALNGHGPDASSFSKPWHTGGLGYKGVSYNIGPSPAHLTINLVNEQEYVTTPMWNVIGIINGTIPDEVVVLGNHRDAWIAGGAGDPNSGSAAFNEVIRSFGIALKAGWKPLRTIVLASWDGEEYGLLGSTEWVEEYLPWLQDAAIAYLNVDVGSVGDDFKTSAAPLLNKVLKETVHLVPSPNQTVPGSTIGTLWDKKISTMGSGSDFTAFQDFAGIPSLDMGFGASKQSAIYQYHSNYDSFDWMQKFGDPEFKYHEAIAKVWALLAARLVETPILQLNATDYAKGLEKYVEDAKNAAVKNPLFASLSKHVGRQGDPATLWHSLDKTLLRFRLAAESHDALSSELAERLENIDEIPWWKFWERVQLFYDIRKLNTKYKLLERQFLYEKGLDGRSWFKHVVFAPGKWTGYSGATFPGIVEALQEGDEEAVRRWIGIAAKVVKGAAKHLEGK